MVNLSKSVAIVGVAESEFGYVPHKTELQLHAEATQRALADAGLTKDDVDGLFTVKTGNLPTQVVAEYLQLFPRYVDSTWTGGSSFLMHVEHAAAAIACGLCDVALITCANSAFSHVGTEPPRGNGVIGPSQFETPYGNTLIADYALAARRHMYQYGTTSEQLAEIAVAMRSHAMLNPLATMREPITVEDVLSSRMIADPLHLLDCCLVTDAGGAVVVTSAERARDCRKGPVYVLGSGEGQTHFHMSQMPDLTTTGAVASGQRAFAMAGLTPADVDVAQIYDSFTITVLTTLEDLGFCKKGEGGAFVQNGRIALGGELPINTDGGGLSSNHPGMRGIFLIIEAVRQLRGECGPRQVQGAHVALCHGTGGHLAAQGTLLLGRA